MGWEAAAASSLPRCPCWHRQPAPPLLKLTRLLVRPRRTPLLPMRAGWEPSQDKRPYGKMCFKSSLERADGSGSGSSSSSSDGQGKQEQQLQGSSTGGSSSSGGGDSGSSSGSSSGGSSSGGGSSGGGFGGLPDLFKSVGGGSGGLSRISDLFGSGSLVSSWTDMSYKLAGGWAAKGPDGSNAYCGKLQGAGAILFKGGGGGLMGKRSISFDVQAGSDGQLPDVTISLGSSSKVRARACQGCRVCCMPGCRVAAWPGAGLPPGCTRAATLTRMLCACRAFRPR